MDDERDRIETIGPRSFACSCGPEGKAFCEEVLAWAYEYLGSEKYPTTSANFLTKTVYHLNWHYMASITGIPNDQWSAVIVETGDKVKFPFKSYIQCDEIEHGLAFVLRALFNLTKGERNDFLEENDGEDEHEDVPGELQSADGAG